MKCKYRITASHCNDAPTLHEEPSFEGETREDCDKAAIARLEELANLPSSAMDEFFLSRIDVVEVTTRIATNKGEGSHEGARRQTTVVSHPETTLQSAA